jgi:predicted MPP superfamily phosphohydrolase
MSHNICIQYISDIHLEYLHIEEVKSIIRKITPVAPILTLAGDLGNPFASNAHYQLFIKEMSNKFEKIFIITGNHEYYGGHTIEDVDMKIQEIVKGFPNITFLHNTYEDYMGIRWIGTTLWSQLDNPTKNINDMYRIKDFNVVRYNALHSKAVESLKNMLEEASIPCIVMTHHMPSYSLIEAMYWDNNYNMWFASHMDNIVEQYKEKIKCWIYGHTHMANTSMMNNVMMLCNPIGYKGENPKKDYNKTYLALV